ncbi:phage major capsid protein [Rhizobium sp. CFBP 13726]|uniref:phage major capsid protein n=1 Tax=Rhizobium sp. CFBP 13726 TaxID=2775296 RepID=UPI001A91A556|nr:phage major capsid protein [Rhizobium sp. CFBP 13726]
MPSVSLALMSGAAPLAVRGSVRNDEGTSRSEQRQLNRLMGDVKQELQRVGTEIKSQVDEHADRIEALETRQLDVEQSAVGRARNRGGSGVAATWGETVAASTDYQAFVANSCKGKAKIPVANAITSVSTSGGALVSPDRQASGVMLPRRRMTIRALLGQGRTNSGSVEYFKETLFVNNAAVVAETAQKPESNIQYELDQAPVRTIAHWIPASRQVMEDAPQLATLVDGSLRYGLAFAEETQLLYGDGLGQNLRGMVPQATAFDITRVTDGDTRIDVISHALSQAEEADLPSSGIILNTRDWLDMLRQKDANGNYLSNGPWSGGPNTLWGLPVVWTNSMARGDFLVGAFETATQIWDRMDPEVLVSDEDRDNFIKNMLTIRAEERLAFAVKRAAALIHGDFEDALAAIAG